MKQLMDYRPLNSIPNSKAHIRNSVLMMKKIYNLPDSIIAIRSLRGWVGR